jgi:hypothetical protein
VLSDVVAGLRSSDVGVLNSGHGVLVVETVAVLRSDHGVVENMEAYVLERHRSGVLRQSDGSDTVDARVSMCHRPESLRVCACARSRRGTYGGLARMCRISLRVTSGPSNSLRNGRSSRRKGIERKFSSQRSWS